MTDRTITDKIYHGCATRYPNRERKLTDLKKGGNVPMPHRIHFGENWTLVIEGRQGNQQTIEN